MTVTRALNADGRNFKPAGDGMPRPSATPNYQPQLGLLWQQFATLQPIIACLNRLQPCSSHFAVLNHALLSRHPLFSFNTAGCEETHQLSTVLPFRLAHSEISFR